MGIFGSPKTLPPPTSPPEDTSERDATRALKKQEKARRESFGAFRRRQEVLRGALRGNPGLRV